MKKQIIGSLLCLLSGCAHNLQTVNVARGVPASEVRIMTSNIAGGRGREFAVSDIFGGTGEITGLEDLIREKDVDICAMQEVVSSGSDQAEEISLRTQLANHAYYPNVSVATFRSGNSIHSRFLIEKSESYPLYKHSPSLASRLLGSTIGSKNLLHGVIDLGEYDLDVISVHLSAYEFNEDEREVEAEWLIRYASEHTPCIIMGDMNAVPIGVRGPYPRGSDYSDDRTWERMFEVASETGVRIHSHECFALEGGVPCVSGTFDDGRELIDHIFVVSREDDPYTIRFDRVEVVEVSYSDHYPVIVDVEIVGK